MNNGLLTEKQQKVARLLASGCNQSEAAKKVGVSRQTINNWLKKDEFLAHVEHLKNDRAAGIIATSVFEQEIYLERLEEFHQKRYKLGSNCRNVGLAILQHVARELMPDKLKAANLTPMELVYVGKFAIELAENGFEVEAQALAVDSLLKEFEDRLNPKRTANI